MRQLVVDVQGFKLENNKFLVKEFAAFDGIHICHYVFKPPFPLRLLSPNLHRQAIWLMNNYHYIDWNVGSTPVHQFGNILKFLSEKTDMIYVKGIEKANYIKKYSQVPVYEFDEQPALQPMESKCFYHTKNNGVCAISNVFFLYNNFMM
ncbi:unnamed protein product [Psylliodes chrysocephalus]|uniref:Uncharacterized protein n=1 Tax=Psylliodes chrysocephalus TaxID=3402493 RepID=A0A9P0CJA0_9CUCU|nr:unnamed protein product [Psylliodes chrysocephala]